MPPILCFHNTSFGKEGTVCPFSLRGQADKIRLSGTIEVLLKKKKKQTFNNVIKFRPTFLQDFHMRAFILGKCEIKVILRSYPVITVVHVAFLLTAGSLLC